MHCHCRSCHLLLPLLSRSPRVMTSQPIARKHPHSPPPPSVLRAVVGDGHRTRAGPASIPLRFSQDTSRSTGGCGHHLGLLSSPCFDFVSSFAPHDKNVRLTAATTRPYSRTHTTLASLISPSSTATPPLCPSSFFFLAVVLLLHPPLLWSSRTIVLTRIGGRRTELQRFVSFS